MCVLKFLYALENDQTVCSNIHIDHMEFSMRLFVSFKVTKKYI